MKTKTLEELKKLPIKELENYINWEMDWEDYHSLPGKYSQEKARLLKLEPMTKTEKEKLKKVWYLVEKSPDPTDALDTLEDTLEKAFNMELENNGSGGKKYAFKIELLGEVTQKLEIKKL
jgi:hypothetical protein